MPIDPKVALGQIVDPTETTWDKQALILYALGLGVGVGQSQVDQKRVLQYTYEKDLKAMPTYAVCPVYSSLMNIFNIEGMSFNPMMLLHGEQCTEIVKGPLPLEATVITEGKVTGVYDKGKAAIVTMDFISKDKESGDVLIKNTFTAFIRGEGGFGGDAKAPAPGNEAPDRAPDEVIEYGTTTSQALLFRLSGDPNPLHCDPDMAKMAGFDIPILHGLCTYGNVGRGVIEAYADNDPERFKSIRCRFSKPVFPGKTVVVEMWKESDTKIICQAKAKERDVLVMSNGCVELLG